MICAVDGLIGAGKSTVLEELRRRGYAVVQEPVRDWGPLLTRFYHDRRRWAFTFQCRVLASMRGLRAEVEQAKKKGHDLVFIERSPASALVFVDTLRKEGAFDDDELRVYRDLHEGLAWAPDRTILVDVPPATCLERIRARARKGEDEIDLAYLEGLAGRYAELLTVNGTVDGARPPAEVADDIVARARE